MGMGVATWWHTNGATSYTNLLMYKRLALDASIDVNTVLICLLIFRPQHWNMSAWAGRVLDRAADSARYTCRSSRNDAGPPVNSTTKFAVECKYPP